MRAAVSRARATDHGGRPATGPILDPCRRRRRRTARRRCRAARCRGRDLVLYPMTPGRGQPRGLPRARSDRVARAPALPPGEDLARTRQLSGRSVGNVLSGGRAPCHLEPPPVWETLDFGLCLPVVAPPGSRRRGLHRRLTVDDVPVQETAELGGDPVNAQDVRPSGERSADGGASRDDKHGRWLGVGLSSAIWPCFKADEMTRNDTVDDFRALRIAADRSDEDRSV